MAPILLACPACKKRISSSAHSCPNCGEPLSDEWEETGRKELKRRRIGLGFLLASVSFAIGAVIIGINNDPDRSAVTQLPVTPSVRATIEPKNNETLVHAFAVKPDLGGGRGLFVDIRRKRLSLGGKQIWVLCPADGTGEIVAAVNGEYVAVNGTARGWAEGKVFWAVQGQQLMPISDLGFPNNVPKRFEVLEPHVDAIIRTGVEMCPLASPASKSAWGALTSAVQNYEANARRLGISIP